uniref:Reverse transcriptase domain-containing protein n=1 Tax=Ascaris lumbricoides TaxID=6252 RepID=A0A0M3IQB4_ASCLU
MIATVKSIASELKWTQKVKFQSQPALQEAFNQLPHVQGGTDTGSAFGVVLDEFVLRRRNGVPLVIFTVSDGYHR